MRFSKDTVLSKKNKLALGVPIDVVTKEDETSGN